MKFLQYEDLRAVGVPFSTVHLYRLMREDAFPAPVKVGANRNAWVESEIIAWMTAKAESARGIRSPRAERLPRKSA